MNAMMFYRIGHWAHRRRVPLLPRVIRALVFLFFNSDIPCECLIGPASEFAHGGIGVVIHPRCRIGQRVMIGQNVTIGGSFGSDVPVIGDNVYIGPGVRIVGALRVGSNVVIGPNSVVNRNLRSNCIAVGIPAQVAMTIPEGALDAIGGTLARVDEASRTTQRPNDAV